MIRNRRFAPLMLAAAVLALMVMGLSACGYSDSSTSVNEGEVLQLGELKYTVAFSRYLNPNDSEDTAYLAGQPEAPDGSHYFGVFLEVLNNTSETQTLAATMTITDATGKTYELSPSESVYAMPFGEELEEHEQIPVLDSTAQQGPLQSTVAIFLLPEEVSSNRPLILHIPGPNGEKGEVKLDL
jgi:hypothetical protein